MKKLFKAPELEVVTMAQDIIATSNSASQLNYTEEDINGLFGTSPAPGRNIW